MASRVCFCLTSFCMILGLTSIPKLAAASEFSENGTSAYLTGQIVDGDDAKFMEFLHRPRTAPLKVLYLSSFGGRVDEAISISRQVRAAHIATAVDATGARCDSACTLIFAGVSSAITFTAAKSSRDFRP